MKQRIWLFLIFIALILGGGALLAIKKVTALSLENMDHPRAVRLWISPSDQFSIFYFPSTGQEPAVEEFQVDRGTIVLKGVKTKSPGILEYYGFNDPKIFHPLHQQWGAVFFKVGEGKGQGLIVKDRKIYFSEMGEMGDRIQLRVMFVPLGYHLFSVLLEWLRTIFG